MLNFLFSKTGFHCRPFHPNEWKIFRALYRIMGATDRFHQKQTGSTKIIDHDENLWRSFIASKKHQMRAFGIFYANVPIGFVFVKQFHENKPRIGVAEIYVMPDFRGIWPREEVMNMAGTWVIKNTTWNFLRVERLAGNIASRALIRQFGFRARGLRQSGDLEIMVYDLKIPRPVPRNHTSYFGVLAGIK